MNQLIRLLILWGIILLFIIQGMNAIPIVQSTLAGPFHAPNRSYTQKMHDVWGPFFDFMQFVQTETPETAVLLFDPKYYYASVNLFFLYPRKLIYGGEETLHSHPEIDYVVISDGFPNFFVAGERIMFDDKQGLYRILK